LLGISKKYDNNINQKNAIKINNKGIIIDSLNNNFSLKELREKEHADWTQYADTTNANSKNFSLGPKTDITLKKMSAFRTKHPAISINDALDSLQMEKSLWNKFLYSRTDKFEAFDANTGSELEKFMDEISSSAAISIFIFLPFFTLFLKLFYLRRKHTYVEHLVFVFHTQTVFFFVLIIFGILAYFAKYNTIWISLLLFLVYLYIAMKTFYQQNHFKTFLKFFILNNCYFILASIGFMILSVLTFALY